MTESRVQRWRTTLEAGRGERGGLIARAIAMHEVQRTDDYPNDRSFEHSVRGDALVARGRHPVPRRGAADRRRPVGRGAGDPRGPPVGVRRARHRPHPGAGGPCGRRDRDGRPHRAARRVGVGSRPPGRHPALPELGRGGPRLAPRPGGRPAVHGRCRRAPARRGRCAARPGGPGDRPDQVGPRRRAGRRGRPSPAALAGARAGRGDLRAGHRDRRRLRHRRLPGRRFVRPCGRLGRVRPAAGRALDDRRAAHGRPRADRRHRRLHEPQGRVRGRRDRPVAELRQPGDDRRPQRPVHRRARPVPGRGRPPRGRRAHPPRARRPADDDPRPGGPAQVRGRGRRPIAQCGSGPARPHRPGWVHARDACRRDGRDRRASPASTWPSSRTSG